eukprot:Hpha_TRINITY_DN15472_c4_g2::TRINITY_DN15472_c4_g2_i1::g.175852::m.175852/K03801/lipB; lipoyl(octanoyl) transferase
MRNLLRVVRVGRIPYGPCLRVQQGLSALRRDGKCPDTLLLVEHNPPVYTVGRRDDGLKDLLLTEDEAKQRGVEVHRISRGGRATWHGPGQLTAYPICNIQKLRDGAGAAVGAGAVRWWVARLEDSLMRALWGYGLAGWTCDDTGVWLGGPRPLASSKADGWERPAVVGAEERTGGDDRKVAAIGVTLNRFVSMHGIALNCGTDLTVAEGIVPCGLAKPITSMSLELRRTVPVPEVADAYVDAFEQAMAQSLRIQPLAFSDLVAELGLENLAHEAESW